jgi:hypothetical protein
LIAVLGDDALKAEFAGLPKQVRPDLTLFEFRNENALRPPR